MRSADNKLLQTMRICTARTKWLAQQAQTMQQAIDQQNDELLNQTFTETMQQLHWKYRPSQQIELPLRPHIAHHRSQQLNLFAAWN